MKERHEPRVVCPKGAKDNGFNGPTVYGLRSQVSGFRRIAKQEKDKWLRALCATNELDYPPKNLFFRAFKKEVVFEMWAAKSRKGPYVLLRSYRICAGSGDLGPKRRRGDLQVPEGFYHITSFNPTSSYYLSMLVDYPNASDRVLGYQKNLGGAIMVHGSCCTIGCIPITDDSIKEVYWLAAQVYDKSGRPIPIHIFPSRLDDRSFAALKNAHQEKQGLLRFWKSLRPGYLAFQEKKKIPRIRVSEDGLYRF